MGRKSKIQEAIEMENRTIEETTTGQTETSDDMIYQPDTESSAESIADVGKKPSTDFQRTLTPDSDSLVAKELREHPFESDSGSYVKNLRLSNTQKDMIVTEELRRIINSDNELYGVQVRTLIDYPYDKDGFTVVSMFVNRDPRLISMAWDYYRDNVADPTVEKFAYKVESIIGASEKFRRVVHLKLN
jgi:hypothetical protein